MLSPADILEQFKNRKQKFCEWRESSGWIHSEVRENYAVYEGESSLDALWGYKEEKALTKRKASFQPCIAINKTAPVVDAISGFQVQNRTEVKYHPRSLQPDKKADIVNSGLRYINMDSGADFENSLAFTDMAITGVGAVDSCIDYSENELGQVDKERVPPYLVGWDISARKRNFIDADWCFRASLIDEEEALDDINDELKENGKPTVSSITGGSDDFLRYFNFPATAKIGVRYNYYWRSREPRYQVENAFLLFPQVAAEIARQDPDILPKFAKDFKCDPSSDKYIFTEDKKAITDIFKFCGIEQVVDNIRQYKVIKHKTYKYYRSSIVGDTLISADENFSQSGHSLKFKRGKWCETRQCPYGVLRAAKEPQRLLNRAVSDLAWHIETNPYGGAFVEIGAVPNGDTEAFLASYLQSREVTFVTDGANTNGKVLPKQATNLPAAIPQMIQFANESILMAMGVNPQFMGMGDSGANEYDVFSQRVKQGLLTLAPYFDAESQSQLDQTRGDVDLLRMLCENTGGLIIKNLMGIKAEDGNTPEYMELLPDDISMEYDMVAVEQPKSQNEKQDQMKNLLDIGQMLVAAQRPDGAALLAPHMIDSMDMPADTVEEIQKAIMPKPTQPDPVNQALLTSQAQLNSAMAEKNQADAKQINIAMLEKVQELGRKSMNDAEHQATIKKILADTELALARAHDLTGGGTHKANIAKAHHAHTQAFATTIGENNG